MKLIFTRGPLLGLRIIVFCLCSILLLLLDHRSPGFHQLRSKASIVVLPLRMVVDWPIDTLSHWGHEFSAYQTVLAENAKLRTRQTLLNAQLQRLLTLENENTHLRQLLSSSAHVPGKVKVAELLSVSLDPSLQQVVINRGSSSGVYVGQPVLDADGVFGQVIQVGVYTSQVMLLTDGRSAIPVTNFKTGRRAIAVGTDNSLLRLINIPVTDHIKVGQLFVSSGLGLVYPIGYPVGVVQSVQYNKGAHFASIILKPTAHLHRSRQLLLVWPGRIQVSPVATKAGAA